MSPGDIYKQGLKKKKKRKKKQKHTQKNTQKTRLLKFEPMYRTEHFRASDKHLL